MKAIYFLSLIFCCSLLTKAQTPHQSITQKDGKHIVYYQNGNIKVHGSYLNNKRDGEWMYYYDNGKIALKKNFFNGEQVGEWSYYNEDGSLILKVNDISKIEEKTEITLYENNKVKTKGVFVNGKREGNWINNDQIELHNKF